MKIELLCVGQIKESFYRQAIAEYEKRLSRYVKFNIIEVKDEKTKENASDKEEEQIREAEGKRLEKYINPSAFFIVLAIEGKKYNSEEFSDRLSNLEITGKSHIQFLIGGSLGVCNDIKKKADMLLSFSDMTFPHQLMRVILAEQIYRAYKIKNNEPYHK